MPQETFDIEHFLRSADWHTLARLRGSAHNTIIGFLSSRWLGYSLDRNFVLDGVPHAGKGRDKRYADLLFCRDSLPLIVVEVESTVSNYNKKLETLYKYLDNTEEFSGLQFGMLVLLNDTGGKSRYQHHWDECKIMPRHNTRNIVLVSFQKCRERLPFNAETHTRLSKSTGYSEWVYQSIDFQIHLDNQVREGPLWPPPQL